MGKYCKSFSAMCFAMAGELLRAKERRRRSFLRWCEAVRREEESEEEEEEEEEEEMALEVALKKEREGRDARRTETTEGSMEGKWETMMCKVSINRSR